jgi:polar amino acid transport system substrate-binding protein
MKHTIIIFQQTLRRWFLQIGIFLLVMIWYAVFASGQEDQKITTIHIATPAWEGYTNADGTGLWFEIVRAVYEPVGIHMSYEIMPWKRAMDQVMSGKADAMLGEYDNKDLVMPRYPLDVERTGVVFKKDTISTWTGVTSLAGKTVVWLRGYNYNEASELAGIKCTWYEVDRSDQAWRMLEKGRVAFYLDDRNDIKTYIETHPLDMTPYQVETAWVTNTYVAFGKSKRAEQLIAIYDQRIPELLVSGELQKLFETWKVEFPPFKPATE